MYHGIPPTYMWSTGFTEADISSSGWWERIYNDGSRYTGSLSSDKTLFIREDKTIYSGPRVRGALHDASWYFYRLDNPVTSYGVNVGAGNGSMTYHGPATVVLPQAPGLSPENIPVYLQDECANLVRSRLDDCRMDAATSLRELPETVSFIADSASRLALAYRDVRRGRVSSALQRLGMSPHDLRGPANNWLAYRYGVRPLVSDVDGAVRTLADRFDRGSDVVRATAKKSWTNVQSSSANGATFSLSQAYEVRYVVEATVTGPGTRVLNQMGFLNPAQFVWEAIPFSFVADWFLPIGDYLSSLTSLAGLSFHRGWLTDRRELTTRGNGWFSNQVWINRRILNGFPEPTFRASGIDLLRLTDAISLLSNLKSR